MLETVERDVDVEFETDRLSRLNIVLKISERCNLKCDYCYFFFAGDDSWKRHPATIHESTIADLTKFISRSVEDYGITDIHLILHGGEPLLMKKSRFENMCLEIRKIEEGFNIHLGLQTNAALIDDEWIDIFERHRISVGVSLDGDKWANDLHRLDTHGRSSYHATVDGMKMLQAAADASRMDYPGLLCVVNPEADGAEIYRHFVHDLGIKDLSFLTPDYTWDDDISQDTIAGIEIFIQDAMRAWLRDRRPDVKIRLFSELLSALIEDDAMDELTKYRDDYRNIISVSSNGDLGPEDTIRVLDPRFSEMGSNVAKASLSDLIRSGVWKEQKEAATVKPDGCKDCGWWKICKAGRPINRFSKENGFNNPSLYCNGLKEIYSDLVVFIVQNGGSLDDVMQRLS